MPALPNHDKPDKDKDNQKWAVFFFAVSILFLLIVIFKGDKGWAVLHRFFNGVFGLSAFIVPIFLARFSLDLDNKVEKEKIPKKLLQGIGGVMLFGTVQEIMFGKGQLMNAESYFSALKMLYLESTEMAYSGMLAGILAYPIEWMFGRIGSMFVILVIAYVAVMWNYRKTLSDTLNLLAMPFRKIKEIFSELSETDEIIRDYDEERREEQIRSEREAMHIAEESGRNRVSHSPEQQLIDVPVNGFSNHPDPMMENLPENLQFGSSSYFEEDLLSQFQDMPDDATLDELGIERMEPSAETDLPEMMPLAFGEEEERFEELMQTKPAQKKKKTKAEEQMETMEAIAEEIARNDGSSDRNYRIPSVSMLKSGKSYANDPNAARELREKATLLTEVLKSFNVSAKITNISRGPAVIRYEVQPAAGVKVSKITGLADDIALNLAAEGVRIEAPIPGKPAIGIEVPNAVKDMVSLREILESGKFQEAKSKLAFAVGRDIAGNAIVGDVAKMPHMIIAGATGSGKSVCTNSIIMSILFHASPAEVRMILIDPKIVEFRIYDGVPHLLIPVVTDPKKAAGALNWAVQEMEKRYTVFAENGVRDLADFNKLTETRKDLEHLPQIVILIDELADLMMTSSKDVEESICRLAQKARAAGMHLIIATQRPTTDIITGLIKANIPSRIALSVKSQIDSRTILDMSGAEKLLGNGDMLYLPSGQQKPVRVQGCFVSTQEIDQTVTFIKNNTDAADGTYDEAIIEAVEQITASSADKNAVVLDETIADSDTEYIERAIEIVLSAGQASTSNLQRRLRLGFARASRIMDELEQMGVIGPYEGAKPRRVLITKEEYIQMKNKKS